MTAPSASPRRVRLGSNLLSSDRRPAYLVRDSAGTPKLRLDPVCYLGCPDYGFATRGAPMANAKSLAGLMKWLDREEWRDAFDELLDQHLAPACTQAGI